MGEPVVDLSPVRLERSIRRVTTNANMLAMYGTSGLVDNAVTRIRRMATDFSSIGEIPGRVVYDVDPIRFDDLIEIRTGGDRAMSLMLNRTNRPAWVSYWPLTTSLGPSEIMAGWDATLQETRDAIHVVRVELGTMLEQALTFDFGYQPVLRDETVMWRQLTQPRWVEEIREQERLRSEAARVERMSVDVSGLHRGTAAFADDLERPVGPTNSRRNLIADDGNLVEVDSSGFDANGCDPRSPGYLAGRCNCADCRQVRLDSPDGDEPDYPEDDDDYDIEPEDDDDYEEDEG